MIEFDLPGLHPSYDFLLRDCLSSLDADYPGVCYRVEMRHREGDISLGCASSGGTITLNQSWFGRPLAELRAASRVDDLAPTGAAARPLPWHGRMEEPHHVLTHEFGHLLQDHQPGWREWATERRRRCLADPDRYRPPSGYCLASVDEFWADAFAAMRLGYDAPVTRELRDFLGGRRG